MSIRALSSCLLGCFLFGLGRIVAIGQGSAVTGLPDDEGYFSYYSQPIAGYDFVPNVPIVVGALGAYDHRFNGLERANLIGLWHRDTQTLLASATVSGGTTSPLQSGYRWSSISPVSLLPGNTYIIGAWNSGDEAVGVAHASTFTVDPRISLGAGYIDTLIPGLQMPTRHGGPGYVFIGPGFAIVPEPSASILMSAAAILACLCRYKRSG